MAVDPDFLEYVCELFSGIGPLRRGRMFSGVALYAEEEAMFAMISSSGTVYMKSDDSTRPAFEAAGATPFWYMRGEHRQDVASLMSLPDSALDDPEEALEWAQRSLPPARAAAAAKSRSKKRVKKRGQTRVSKKV